jgi:dienelactone hydrolase
MMAALPLLAVSSAKAAEDPEAIAKAFGARPSVQSMSLSPDGSKIAFIAPTPGHGASLMVVDLAASDSARSVLHSTGEPEQISNCNWVTSSRLICTIYGINMDVNKPLPFSRLIAVNSDGTALKLVSAQEGYRAEGVALFGGDVIDWTGDADGSVLMMRRFLHEDGTGTLVSNRAEGLGVERVNTLNLSRQTVETAKINARDYITDGKGTVRIMGLIPPDGATGYDSNHFLYSYRPRGSREWRSLGRYNIGAASNRGFAPLAVDPDKDVVYGFDDLNGRRALYSISLADTTRRDMLLSRPEVDVDQLITIGRQHRVVGASYATERREIEFFDPELRQLRAALSRAIPQAPIIDFIDTTADESKLLLVAGSDTNPGRYYLLDRKTKQMGELLPVRPALAGMKLAEMRPVKFPAADGTMIPGYLTLPQGSAGKRLPTIVMPHGGPAARDEWGFDWLAQYFVARGFAVLQPNFRGSAGYGANWFKSNGFQSWRTAIGDVNDAGRWLISQGIADPGKLAIVGWSYGGYAALQSAVLDPDLYKAIVAIAPVTDLQMLKEQSRLFTNYANVLNYIGDGAHIREGSPARNAAAIKAPVLMFHGLADANVAVNESRFMADRLKAAGKKVELVEFKALDHQLDDDVARTDMLLRSDRFLRSALGL